MNLWFIITPKPVPSIEQIRKKNNIIHCLTDLNVTARKIQFHLNRLWLTYFDNNHNNNFALWLKYSSVVSSDILYRLVLLVCKFLIFFLKENLFKKNTNINTITKRWKEKMQTYSIYRQVKFVLKSTRIAFVARIDYWKSQQAYIYIKEVFFSVFLLQSLQCLQNDTNKNLLTSWN